MDTNTGKAGVLLGGAMVTKAVNDDKFYEDMPEFASIKAQIETMHIDISSKGGCNSCNKRRLLANVEGNFAAIASKLPDDRAKSLKKYFGIEDDRPLLIRAINQSNGQMFFRKIY